MEQAETIHFHTATNVIDPIDTTAALRLRRTAARFAAKVDAVVTSMEGGVDFAERQELFAALKRLAQNSDLTALPPELSLSLSDRFESIRGMYLAFYQELEYRAAQKILRNQTTIESSFRSHNHSLVQQEVLRGEITAASRVAFVGCGCLPWSAVAIHQLSGAEVVGFDRDSALVRIASRVLAQLGMGDRIRVATAEGDQIDYDTFSHVYLAGMCDQKADVARRISAALPVGGKLLVRSGRSPYQIFYPQCTDLNLPHFVFRSSVRSSEVDELETFVFERL